MSHKPDELPKPGTVVEAVLQHWNTKGTVKALLRRVKEGDCDWRTADDNSEVSYDWNVISWEVIAEASMSHVFVLGTNKKVVCDICGASEVILLPASIDAFVEFLRKFEQEHQHNEKVQHAGGKK